MKHIPQGLIRLDYPFLIQCPGGQGAQNMKDVNQSRATSREKLPPRKKLDVLHVCRYRFKLGLAPTPPRLYPTGLTWSATWSARPPHGQGHGQGSCKRLHPQRWRQALREVLGQVTSFVQGT